MAGCRTAVDGFADGDAVDVLSGEIAGRQPTLPQHVVVARAVRGRAVGADGVTGAGSGAHLLARHTWRTPYSSLYLVMVCELDRYGCHMSDPSNARRRFTV